MTVKLGINIDHIATIREARKIKEPDPVTAALIAELAGCDTIVAHLRRDKRHIQDRDVRYLRGTVTTKLDLQIEPTTEMLQTAINCQPDLVTLVPENSQEITTEGGLNVAARVEELSKIVATLKNNDIATCLFIDPETEQVKAAKKVGADFVEFNTNRYAMACILSSQQEVNREISAVEDMVVLAKKYGLRVFAGHGLDYRNIQSIAAIDGIEEINVGHSIVARSVFVGIEKAVKEMKEIISKV